MHTPGRIRAIKEEILGAIQSNLSPSQIFLIQSHLNMIDALTKQIAEIDAKISGLISTMHKTPAGERRKSLTRDAKLLEKVARSYEPHW
jgi:hypothetical protein